VATVARGQSQSAESRARTRWWSLGVLATIATLLAISDHAVIGSQIALWTVLCLLIRACSPPPRGVPTESERLLAAGCCPACEYRIDDLPTEHDGRTRCPECGGHWRLGAGAVSITSEQSSDGHALNGSPIR